MHNNRMNNRNTPKISTQLLDCNICPCCNLLKSVYSFIDPVYFTTCLVCNDCRRDRIISSISQKKQDSKSIYQESISKEIKDVKKDTSKKNIKKQKYNFCTPQSNCYIVPTLKAQRLKKVYEAKLLFHRLYINLRK